MRHLVRYLVVCLGFMIFATYAPPLLAQAHTNCVGEGCGGGGGEDVEPPTISLVQPGGSVYTQYPTIVIGLCDDHALYQGTQNVKVNGVGKTSSFTWSYGSQGGCADYATLTTSSVALTLGTNTIWVRICDQTDNCSTDEFYIEYGGAPPTVVLATRDADIRDYARCAMSCFAATYAQSTVPYFTFDTPRSVTLAYNSDAVNPRPFILLDVTHGGGTLPDSFAVIVRYNGAARTFVNGDTLLKFTAQNVTMRIGLQFTSNQFGGTGAYPVTVEVGGYYPSGWVSSSVNTRVLVVNNTSSPIGRGWSIAGVQRLYKQGANAMIADGDGSATFFTSLGGGAYSTPTGDFTRLDSVGGRYRRTYPDSTRVTFTGAGLMDSIVDRFGNVSLVTYDGSNRVSTIADPTGTAHTLSYGTYGLASIAALSRTTTTHVNSGAFLTAILDPDNDSTTFTYTDTLLTAIRDRGGNTTALAYSSPYRQLASVTTPSVNIYGVGNTTLTLSQVGWQRYGVPTTTTAGSPYVAPKADSVQATVTDAGGHVRRMKADSYGQAARITGALGDTVVVTVNGGGLPTSVADRLGATTSSSYDANGFRTSVTRAGLTTNYRKGPLSQVDSVWGQGPARRLFVNSSNGRVDSARVGGRNGTLSRYWYGYQGQLDSARDSSSHLVARHWYDASRNLSKDSLPTSVTTVIHRDVFGRPDSVTVSTQPVRRTVYDVMNRPIQQYDGVNANPTTYHHGGQRLDSITDPAGQVYRFGYNALGWLTTMKDPAAEVDTTQYDRDGLVVRTVNRRAQAITMTYDSLHRMTWRGGSGAIDVGLGYSASALIDSTYSAYSVVTRFLNATHRMPDSVRTLIYAPGGGSSQTYVAHFAYTPGQNRSSVSYTGAASIMTRLYKWRDTLGILDSIRLGSKPGTALQYSAELQGMKTRFSSSDSLMIVGITESHGPTVISSPGLWEYYGYDRLGRITVAQNNPYAQQRQYSYDQLGRLDSVQFHTNSAPGCSYNAQIGYVCGTATPDSTHDYSFDEVGNRTDNGGGYATGNRLHYFGPCTYSWNDDGAVTGSDCTGTPSYSWSSDGLLLGYTVNGTTVAYAYDALGRLVRKDVNGAASSYFLWDGDNLVAELGSNGTSKVAEYSYYLGGLDHLHAMLIDTSQYNAHTDQMGNVRALTRGGSLSRSYVYDEWGHLSGGSGSFGSNDRARWKGALWMGPELDLYYMRNRWYDASTGRFLSEDPLGLQVGINEYTFAGGDPINRSDPIGLSPCNGRAGHVDPGTRIWWDGPNGEHISFYEDARWHDCSSSETGTGNTGEQGGTSGKYGGGPGGASGSPGGSARDNRIGDALPVVLLAYTDMFGFLLGGTASLLALPVWPSTPAAMDQMLGIQGTPIPDGPTTTGRGKIVWQPNENTTITFEQHPYHVGGADWHTGPHWHLDTPGREHQRYLPGQAIPGY